MRGWLVCLVVGTFLVAGCDRKPPQQFDLTCNGTYHKVQDGRGEQTTAFRRHFRVDLAALRWCTDKCDRLLPLARVDAGKIVLNDFRDTTDNIDLKGYMAVDRVTGGYEGHIESTSDFWHVVTTESGHCDVHAFSGMPQTKF